MVTLERLGCDGNGTSVGRLAHTCGIGTVVLYCKRVVEAIMSMEEEFIRWPDSAERRIIAHRIEEDTGFPGCVGVVDGTHVHFAQRPAIDPECYWTRKHKYSINATVVCDDKRRILYYQVLQSLILIIRLDGRDQFSITPASVKLDCIQIPSYSFQKMST